MVGRHATLVAPEDVDLPPVDLVGAVGGQALVAAPGGVTPGQGHAEALVGTAVEGLDHPLGEFRRDVVDDDQVALHLSSPNAVRRADS